MELTISPRRQQTGLAVISQKPWALAIRKQYGELPAFAAKFTPAVQKYCAANIRKAVEDELPTFGRLVNAYGEAGIAQIINAHMTDAILRMGEDRDVDPYDVQFISEAICQSERFRLLRFPSVFAFFHLLKCGEFDIYGKVTPRKILEAFRKYAIEQQARENRIAYEKECREQREERDRWAAQSSTWEDYARSRGIPDMNWAAYVCRMADQYQAQKKFIELLFQFMAIIRFIADWKER